MVNPRKDAPPLPGMSWRLGVTFAVAAVLFMDPIPQSMARNLLGLAIALVDRGSVWVNDFNVDVAVRDGRTLSGMPPGASFIAALLYFLFHPVLRLLPAGSTRVALYVLSTITVAIPAAAVTVCLVHRIALRWGVPGRSACLTAGLFAFGTMHFGYATGFYKNTLAPACLLGAFTLLAWGKEARLSGGRAGLAGVLCGVAVGQDYPTAVIAAALGGYFLWRRPRAGAIAAFASGGVTALLPVLVYHQVAFGSPWATAYQFRIVPASNTMGPPQLGPFMFLAITLLAASPCLVWSAVGWWRGVQTQERRAEMVTIAGIVLGTLLLFSGWPGYYTHEASFPSRQLLAMLPFAALPMAFGLPASLRGWPLVLIGWSVGATLLAAQASMIPTNTIPPVYALKVLGTSWGTGPLFSEVLASWLGLPTLHLTIARKMATTAALLRPENRGLLVELLLGQALIKAISLTVTALAAVIVWRLVWRPVMTLSGPRVATGPPTRRGATA